MKTVLSVDPGSEVCGYALLHATGDPAAPTLVECGSFACHSEDPVRRVRRILEMFQEKLPGWGGIDVLAHEVPYNRSFGTERLWTVVGALYTLPAQRVYPVHVATARAAWGCPGGTKRAEGKKGAVEAANKRFGLSLELHESDAADAVWIGVGAIQRLKL